MCKNGHTMKGLFLILYLLICMQVFSVAQHISYSEPLREDSRDMNFDIIGKLNANILVFKNERWKYAVSVYNNNMELKEKIKLDFMPEKTFNVDFVAYPDYFFLIYQYQKRGIVYCMSVKMDANGHTLTEPVQLDTTQVGLLEDNKIYATVNSDDKQRIMVFKIQKKHERFNFVTFLYDNQLRLLHKTRQEIEYDDRKEVYSDFLLDNEGNFVFAKSVKSGNRDYLSSLNLVTKGALEDNFTARKIELKEKYIDEVKIKIDNINKRYLFNSFYYTERRGNIEGIYCSVWDIKGDSSYANIFTPFDDSIRADAKSTGNPRYAFNEFYIRSILLKKDGGYILTAENYSTQTNGSRGLDRWNYLYNSPAINANSYYYNNPAYSWYYRPLNSFNNNLGTTYYYNNILVLGISNKAEPQWSNIIHKEQYSDESDNFLSFNTFNTGGDIHFLFNNTVEKRDRLISDYIVAPDGSIIRNPTIKSYEKGYEFMPRFGRQVGARQIIIPCTFRNRICFAKVDF